MAYMLVQSTEATLYDFASDAIDALRDFEASTEKFYQYEIRFMFDNERNPIGMHVIVKCEDGFTVGYLRTMGEA